MPLSSLAPKNAQPKPRPYKLADERGLYLLVNPTGSKLWRLNYRFQGKHKTLALGGFPDVGLAEARSARDAARKLLAAGVDPSTNKQAEKRAARRASEETFEALADEWLEQRKQEGLSEQTLYRDAHILKTYGYPTLGKRPTRDIRPIDVLDILRTLETRELYDTAHRFRSLCSRVFRLGITTDRAEQDPAAVLQDVLIPVPVQHHPGLTDPRKVGGLMRAIEGYDGHPATRLGMEFLARTMVRTAEMRKAEWPDFDMKAKLWRIPGAKMKMKRDHLVPLSKQALVILDRVRAYGFKGPWVFPAERNSHRIMSENTINAALRRMGYSGDQHVGHGFRTTASTTLNESGRFHTDWIERQLAHVEGNSVRRAYNAAEYLPDRIKMMQWYSDWLDTQRDLAELLG